MSNIVQSPQTFDEWFDSLTSKQQKEYFEEQEADYWIDYYKEHPQYE